MGGRKERLNGDLRHPCFSTSDSVKEKGIGVVKDGYIHGLNVREKEPVGKGSRGWEDNIKMDLTNLRFRGMD